MRRRSTPSTHRPDRWEQGSDYHLIFPPAGDRLPGAWEDECAFFRSGRDALYTVILNGRRVHNWRTLWIPTYFCQEVLEPVRRLGLQVMYYRDSPCHEPLFRGHGPVGRDDVVLTVNYFGLRSAAALDDTIYERCSVIEDHTHDPWSSWAYRSRALYCVASLRKTLPIPDGGVAWSPRGCHVPQAPSRRTGGAEGVHRKLWGMILKSIYLGGGMVAKEDYRTLFMESEASMDSDQCLPMSDVGRSLLASWPTKTWRKVRLANFRKLADSLSSLGGMRVLWPEEPSGSCPFMVSIVFDSTKRRAFVLRGLIDRRIFPAVLWDLRGAPWRTREIISLSKRILSIHCDMRYNARDMKTVSDTMRSILAQYSPE